MKLHEAVDAVLADRPAGMTTRELADEIERRGLYLKGDGKSAPPGQVNARVGNKTYRDRYRKDPWVASASRSSAGGAGIVCHVHTFDLLGD
jgi:hypothetical protein